MKVLYVDAFSGLSGDKIAAGLLSLTNDTDYLINELNKLNIADEFEIKIKNKNVMGIDSLKFDVILKDHHHDNEAHHHRGLKEITEIINNSKLDDKVKKDAINVFTILGEAEAHVHNVDIQKIHFHEVGAIDSIVDIISACVLINKINPDKIYSSKIALGNGFINAAHGRLPVPAPATAKILEGVPVYSTDVLGELTTPTGASIIKYYAEDYCNLPEMIIDKTGYGAGTKEFEIPNVVRIYLGNQDGVYAQKDTIIKLETNIDDATPEQLGFIFEKLFEKGALDVFISPVMMKKNRMGHLLSVLCDQKYKEILENEIFKNTTTFGIRYQTYDRVILKREQKIINIDGIDVKIKSGYLKNELIQTSIEYESIKEFMNKTGLTYNEANKRINDYIYNNLK